MIAISVALAYLGTIALAAFWLWLEDARAERALRTSWLAELAELNAKQADASRMLLTLQQGFARASDSAAESARATAALERRIADLEKRDALRRSP